MDREHPDKLLEPPRDGTHHPLSSKGQKAINKRSRAALLSVFRPTNNAFQRRQTSHTEWGSSPSSPSTASLEELTPITISELLNATRHVGKVLFVRTFVTAQASLGLHTAVEDIKGDVDQLAVHHVHPTLPAFTALPRYQILAVKEPYYEKTMDGKYTIHIDHPSDLISLEPNHALVPIEFRDIPLQSQSHLKDAQTHKKLGNIAYATKRFHDAFAAYTRGINKCAENDTALLADLYRNRSVVNLHLERYELAEKDAITSLLQGTDNARHEELKGLNGKALLRAGRASYELGRYEEAEQRFKDAISLNADDKDAQIHLARVRQRSHEVLVGSYDFAEMQDEVKQGKLRLDHASFLSRVEVRQTTGRGRGLFATQDIKAGELILCEKAFDICDPKDKSRELRVLMDVHEQSILHIGSEATLLYQLVDKLRFNPVRARSFFDLHAGDYKPRCGVLTVDLATVIDVFEVETIIGSNHFLDPSTRSYLGQSEADLFSGIWVIASYINHDCVGNARRCCHGDMMSIRATRHIREGEEIMMPYATPRDVDPAQGIVKIQRKWKFACGCALCLIDKKVSAHVLQERQDLWTTVIGLLMPQSQMSVPIRNLREQVETLYKQLAPTYDKVLYQDMPRLALVPPSLWLCQVSLAAGQFLRCIDYAIEVLKNLAYNVQTSKHPIRISGKTPFPDISAVDAAMLAMKAYAHFSDELSIQAFHDFAAQAWTLLHGDMDGFEARYRMLTNDYA